MNQIITRKPPPKDTPWGFWQEARQHAPGIVFVSTPGHGGFHLDEERQKEAHVRIGRLPTFTGSQAWLEEDQDAVLVYLIWPEYASDEQIAEAIKTTQVYSGRWIQIKAWLDRSGQAHLWDRARACQRKAETMWELYCTWTLPSGMWDVTFTRPRSGADDDQRTVQMKQYPEKKFYTTEELDAIEWKTEEATP